MTATLPDTETSPRAASRRFLADLDARRQVFEHLTPNWFAAVMGTGIVATAAVSLPASSSVLTVFATVVWVLASVLLVLISAAFVMHWIRHPHSARRYVRDPLMVQFYGAIPMACLTVGAGFLHLGPAVVGSSAATGVGVVLWCAGTLFGVATSVWVPYSVMTSEHSERLPGPAWLMPVVPPMVSASTGAAVVTLVPEGQVRLGVLSACYMLFGISLVLGMMTLVIVYARLLRGAVPEGRSAPTIWISLGLIGQSITAANLLGAVAITVFTGSDRFIGLGLRAFGVAYGLPMAGFGAVMFILAVAVTVRTVRRGLPFALTWWSFTFPIGTCVTGLSALGAVLGATVVKDAADVLYAVLVCAWVVVAVRTAHTAFLGRVFLPVPAASSVVT